MCEYLLMYNTNKTNYKLITFLTIFLSDTYELALFGIWYLFDIVYFAKHQNAAYTQNTVLFNLLEFFFQWPIWNARLTALIVKRFQISETMKTATELLSDLSGFRNFRKEAESLKEEFQNWRQEQFDDWSRDVQEQIDDPKQPLR